MVGAVVVHRGAAYVLVGAGAYRRQVVAVRLARHVTRAGESALEPTPADAGGVQQSPMFGPPMAMSLLAGLPSWVAEQTS